MQNQHTERSPTHGWSRNESKKVHEQNQQYFQIHSTTSNFETFTIRGQTSPLTDNWGYECEKTQNSSFEIQLVIVRVSTRFEAQDT